MGLTVTEDTPADMLAGNMELLVQLPPRNDDEYEDENYDVEDDHHSNHRNHHRHHNHHHNGHQRRTSNGNARRVIVARSTPMMDLLVQVATSQKLSASSYTLEAIGEHGLVLTHHPNTPIGALDALQVKLLPKQGTFVPMKARHVNQPFETTFRLQVHLPRNQLYVSRVSSRMNLGKILDEVCREKNLDRNKYELCHPANIEETLDLSLSLQDYHIQEVTLCPKRRSLGSSLSSQDIMALQRQEERRRQDAKQSVFGFAFKKSKESSLSTDSLGERSVSPTRSDGTGRSASPQAPTAPTRPQRKRRQAPKPPMPQAQPEPKTDPNSNATKEAEETLRERAERIVISHSRNSSDSSGYHEASVLSDNLDSNIRVPETLPRRGRLQPTQESPGRTLAESSQASKSLGNLAAVQPTPRIARVTSNSSLSSAGGLRKKKAAPPPPQPRPLSSAISTQALERIVDSEESLTSDTDSLVKAASDVAVTPKRNLIVPRLSLGSDERSAAPKIEADSERRESVDSTPEEPPPAIPSISKPEIAVVPIVETPSEHKQKRVGVDAPVPKPRGTFSKVESVAPFVPVPKTLRVKSTPSPTHQTPAIVPRVSKLEKNIDGRDPGIKSRQESGEPDDLKSPKPIARSETKQSPILRYEVIKPVEVPRKPKRKILPNPEVEESNSETETERKENSEKPVGEERSDKKQAGITIDRTFDDLIMRQNVVRKIMKVEKVAMKEEKKQIVDGKRSCAVISTIPKCDHFEEPGYDLKTKVDSVLGSFVTGKSILDDEYQRGLRGATSSVTVVEEANNGTDDELELENFEMFERSKNFPKLANLARSHSELNNFEINTFKGNGRHLTSASGDFTFALNHNLARKVTPELSKPDFTSDKVKRSDIKSKTLTRNGAPKLPAFLTTAITWEREDLLQDVENDFRSTAWRLGQSESGEDIKTVTTVTGNSVDTSDLLKKVSDTLSESLRSPETSSANDHQKTLYTATKCVEEPQGPGDEDDGVNEAKPSSESREKDVSYFETGSAEIIVTDFLENRQTPVIKQSEYTTAKDYAENIAATEDRLSTSATIDWEYPIPEPPSEFRDTEVESKVLPAKKTLFIPEEVPRIKAVEIRPEEPIRPRTISVNSSESRRGSQASSTPTVAPVDNTLSNFVITTYSRPKNVDIFDEVETRRIREVETPVSRKNSTAGSNRTKLIVEEVKKSTESQPRVSITEENSGALKEKELETSSRTETTDTVNRSNIEISIATKPRPRADTIEIQLPKIVDVKISRENDLSVPKDEISNPEETEGANQKFSKWRDNILKRHETPDKETQLQSAQVLKSIFPQLEETRRNSDTQIEPTEKSASNSSEEARVIAALPKSEETSSNRETKVEQTLPVSPAKEPATKRYTYAGPPAIDLGSWSDRSRTIKVQIKPDSDYKFEKSRSPESERKETQSGEKEKSSTVIANKNSSNTTLKKSSTISTRFEKESKDQPTELPKVLRAQSIGGFRRPASIAVDPSRDGDKELQRIFGAGLNRREQVPAKAEEKEEEIDTRPMNFKELKQAFAKDQNSGSVSIPKYGNFPRRQENSGTKFTVRRDSLESENTVAAARINKPLVVSGQEKRSFVVPATNFRNGFQEATRKTSRGTLMPVVKGFKSVVVNEDDEKRSVNRIAIGDISNGNHVPSQNGLRKTVQIKIEDSNCVPKPPTMPVITGVTLKSTNYNNNSRPKSMPVEPNDRNQLLESIRNFGPDQLKRIPRRNTNVVGLAPGSRSVRS